MHGSIKGRSSANVKTPSHTRDLNTCGFSYPYEEIRDELHTGGKECCVRPVHTNMTEPSSEAECLCVGHLKKITLISGSAFPDASVSTWFLFSCPVSEFLHQRFPSLHPLNPFFLQIV